MTVRLRQIALVAARLAPVAEQVERELGLGDPFHDPGVGEFGLENAVWAAGDTFLEVVAPVRADTTAGRYLERRGGDGGYMALFQVPDVQEARRRVADLGVRVVWQADLADIAGTHLHPRDVPGAIVSLDAADPAGSWRWGGPAWAGQVPDHGPGGLLGATVALADPAAGATRWAAVLGVDASEEAGMPSLRLDGGAQVVRFVPAAGGADRITEIDLAVTPEVRAGRDSVDVGGVTFRLSDPAR